MNASIFSLSETHQWAKIRLSGPDARDFLHRITTARVRAMNPGQGNWAAILNSQGKIRAQFVLWCEGEDQFSMELAPGKGQLHLKRLLEAIDQFTFAERMKLETELPSHEASPYWVRFDSEEAFLDQWEEWFPGTTPSTPEKNQLLLSLLPSGQGVIHHHGSKDFGFRWVSVWSNSSVIKGTPWTDQQQRDWDHARIRQIRPWVDSELNEEVNPLEVGAPDAIAENKGCYPGQEVIEKIAAIGSPAKRLVRVTGRKAPTESVSVGDRLLQNESDVGVLTTIQQDKDHWSGLALVRKTVISAGTPLKTQVGIIGQTDAVAPYLNEDTIP